MVIGGIFFLSWYFPIGMSLPFRYYLHFIYKYEHGIMISRNAITNAVFGHISCHVAPRNSENLVDFLCKSSETQETLALALFIPSAQS